MPGLATRVRYLLSQDFRVTQELQPFARRNSSSTKVSGLRDKKNIRQDRRGNLSPRRLFLKIPNTRSFIRSGVNVVLRPHSETTTFLLDRFFTGMFQFSSRLPEWNLLPPK